jgi:hypothetical protein
MFWFHKLHNTGDEMSRRRTRMSPLFWAELPITSSRGKASGHDHLVQPHSVIRCSRWNPSQIFRVDEISSRQDSYPEQRKVILECVQAAVPGPLSSRRASRNPGRLAWTAGMLPGRVSPSSLFRDRTSRNFQTGSEQNARRIWQSRESALTLVNLD